MNYQETLTYLYNSALCFSKWAKMLTKRDWTTRMPWMITFIILTANSIRFTWQELTGKVLVRIHWLPFYRLQAIKPDFILLLT